MAVGSGRKTPSGNRRNPTAVNGLRPLVGRNGKSQETAGGGAALIGAEGLAYGALVLAMAAVAL